MNESSQQGTGAAAVTGASCCAPRAPASAAATTSTPSQWAGLEAAHAASAAPAPGGPARAWCRVPAGVFAMGNDGRDAVPGDGEGPVREVDVAAFRAGATTVTNAEFAEFVRQTHHVTDAERLGNSFVFYLQMPEAARARARQVVSGLPWWLPVDDASWQRPLGPGSQSGLRPGHPVVHVSWNDAQAYCDWAGTRLPSEAEWEYAARGGLAGQRFAWGDELFDGDGVPRCNVFRGQFPNAPQPGWDVGPVAADAGIANGYGLFNVCGNVWEWCADPLDGGNRPLRGGSFLCHDSYCNRYRVAARNSNTPTSAASNIGFRVVG